MASYNRINQTYACENSKTINGLLKTELNFQGFVVSDWNGQHSGISSTNAGLDVAMPVSSFWDDSQLAKAVKAKDLNETRLIDMATRIVATWYQFGQNSPSFPKLGIGMPPDLLTPHTFINARDPEAKTSLLQQAIEGHILVKNINNTLPLKKPTQLSVSGYDALPQSIFNPGPVPVDGLPVNLFQTNWAAINISKSQLFQIVANEPVTDPPETAQGVLVAGGASGSNTPAYISAPYDALLAQAYEDGTSIFYDFNLTDPNVAAESDACLVFINEFASETWDRPGLADLDSDKLVSNVANKCSNTVVVIHNAGVRLVDAWIDNPNITAVIFAHLPGQDAGRAIVQILYGTVSPSGRLPYTVAKSAEDYGDLLAPCGGDKTKDPQCDFKEGVEIDYRGFLARKVQPRFEFGFGLTYSTFSYANLVVNINATAENSCMSSTPVYSTGGPEQNSANPDIGVGGLQCLFDSVGTIQATITNTGQVAAAEVAQLYLQTPKMTTRALRGFQKVFIEPAQSAEVTFNLRRKDTSNWDVVKQAWIVSSGTFDIFVGKSVLDIQLNGTFSIQ